MKKIISLLIILTIVQTAYAQNATIAKFKFEEAEQAFVNNDYKQTIIKLDEAETLLKSTNPKILHLKISAQYKLIEQNPYNDYTILESAKKSSVNYLKECENLPNNEDKYREIYIISEKLKEFPNSSQDFETYKNQQKIKKEKSISADLEKKKADDDKFSKYVYYKDKDYKLGMTVEETVKAYPDFKKHYTFKNTIDNTYEYSITAKNGIYSKTLKGFFVKNNKVIGYSGSSSITSDDTEFSVGFKKASEIVNTLKTEFNFDPTIEVKDGTYKDYIGKFTNYIWSKNNKTITVSLLTQSQNGSYYHIISISSLDQNLAK